MGRGKKEVKKIEDKSNRQVTFSRRKKGLIKKVYELSVLCDIDIALIMFSPAGRLTQFSGKKRTEEVVNRYLNLTDEEREEVIPNRESWIKILNEIMTNDDKELQLSKAENVNPQFEELQQEVGMLQQQLQISEERLRVFEPYQSLDFKSIEELESMEKTLKNTLEHVLQRKGMLASFENQVTNPTPAPFPHGDLSRTPAYPLLRGSSSRMGESCVNDPDPGHFPLWSPSSTLLFPPIQHEVEGPSMIQYEVEGSSKIQYEVGRSSMAEAYDPIFYEVRGSSIAEVCDPILYEVEGPSMVEHQVGGLSMVEYEVRGPSVTKYEVGGPSMIETYDPILHEVGGGPLAPQVQMATDEASGGEEA